MNALVSVVIPFYKNTSWLYEAIESVINQTYRELEIIIINDGSKEKISLEQFNDCRIKYFYQNNRGAASARNFGINVSSGDYVAFLDSDDKWSSNKIEKQVDFLEKHMDYMWVHCSYQTFGDGKSRIINSSNEEGFIFPECLKTLKIGTPCVMIRNSVLKENPQLRFNEAMKYGEDFFLWVSMAKKYKLGALTEILCFVRMHGNNAARSVHSLLKSRSDFKKMSNDFIEWENIEKRIRKAYELCLKREQIIERLSFLRGKPKLIEIISKIFYFRPYLMLHRKGKNDN